jgi:hypothetical protein
VVLRTKPVGGLAANGKLKDRCSLATRKKGHQYFSAIWEFECVVMPVRSVLINGAKSRYAEAGALSPYPAVIKLNIFVKSQFGAGKEADSHFQMVLRGKAACRRMPEARRDEFVGDLGGARLDGVQAIVTHVVLLSRGRASEPGLAGASTG